MKKSLLEQYFKECMRDWEADAIANTKSRKTHFLEMACELLTSQGYALSDFSPAYHIEATAYGNVRPIVDGYSYDESENMLTLVICDFSEEKELQRISKADFDNYYKRLERFFVDVQRGKYDTIDPGREVYQLIQTIKNTNGAGFKEEGGTLNLHLITNKVSNCELPAAKEISRGCKINYFISDFTIISEIKPQPIVVDFSDYQELLPQKGIPYLSAVLDSRVDFYQAYLIVMPAEVLVKCYDTYRARILEQNVRVYLQKRGKINQGIHNTIAKDPHAFFIYNNGLAITAEQVDFSSDGSLIEKIHGLQVVNGGQTIACLHHASKEGKSVEGISVQVKLTVVPKEITPIIVPYISRYSNSQNAVKDTDQHSNDLVQIALEQHSKKIKTPGVFPQSWYYERMRGQYANAQLHLSEGYKKKFQRQNPKDKVVQPTTLSQAVMICEMAPYLVVRGAQKTYNGDGSIKGFCDYASSVFRVNPGFILDPRWYKTCIGKMILHKQAKKCVREVVVEKCSQLKSFSSSITTYTMAGLIYMLSEKQMSINYLKIWEMQDIDDTLVQNLQTIAAFLIRIISSHADHSEWLKKKTTWESLKQDLIKSGVTLLDANGFYSTHAPVLMSELVKVRESQDGWGPSQIRVMSLTPDIYWEELKDWLTKHMYLCAGKIPAYLDRRINNKTISEDNSSKLISLAKQAAKDGWCPPCIPEQKCNIPRVQIQSLQVNPIAYYSVDEGLDVLVLDRTTDLKSGSMFINDLFRKYPHIQHEEAARAGENEPSIGSIEKFNLNDGRHIVFAYTRKTADSIQYLPILEVCLQEISRQFPNKRIMMNYVGCEEATQLASLRRGDIKALVQKILYAHDVFLASQPSSQG